MSNGIIRIGPGIKNIKKNYGKLGYVEVGIIDAGQEENSPLTVASIGYIQEYGTDDGRIPERSFMRSTIKEKQKEVIAMQKKLLIKIRKNTITSKHALGLIGEFMADAIKQKIISLSSPANAESTIKRKGSSNPLIDKGQLKNSITYRVII